MKRKKFTPKKGLKINFEGENRQIPEEGAEVNSSLYYRGLVLEGSGKFTEIKQKKTEEKGA